MKELLDHIESIRKRVNIGIITTLNATDHILIIQIDRMTELVREISEITSEN